MRPTNRVIPHSEFRIPNCPVPCAILSRVMKAFSRETDVIVAGGGVAGVAAAVASARLGARTLLVERYGFLGGLSTAGLVGPFMTWKTASGEQLIAGLFQEILDRLQTSSGLQGPSFDAATLAYVLQEMVLESGAELLLHSWVCGAEVRDRVLSGAKLQTKSGVKTIRAGRFVDATGDGDLAVQAGAQFQQGRPRDGMTQAATLMFDLGGADLKKTFEYIRSNPDQMCFPKLAPDADLDGLLSGPVSAAGFYDILRQAKEAGEYDVPGDLVFFISRPRRGEVAVNTTHVGNVDCTTSEDLTRAEIEGRRQMMNLVSFFRKYVPGFENCYLARMPTQVGVRETRRILGEYAFAVEDVAEGRKFPDAITRLAYPVDIHDPSGSVYTRDEEKRRRIAPPPGDWYEIPYRCLLPLGIENLLVAGRCVSSTHEGHSAIRIMPCCIAMGQAAGAAAALSLKAGVSPRSLDMETLKAALREQGALV